MQNSKQRQTNPMARTKNSIRARFPFNAILTNGVVCLSACVALLSGCSGFPTDGLAGAPLSERPFLPAGPTPVVQPEADETINKLARMVGATAKSTVDTSADDTLAPPGSQNLQTPGFRFSTELPIEPDYNQPPTVAEITPPFAPAVAPAVAPLVVKSIEEPTRPTKTNIILVAATQPIGAGITPEPHSLPVRTDFVPRPLRPIATPKTIPDPAPPLELAPAKEIKFVAEPPALSAADLREFTQPAVDTFSIGSSESIDLSDLELESTLANKPTPPAVEPPKKSLTAAEHLSETIRLIEEAVSNAGDSGERHGADPGLRLLEILLQKMDHVSSANWRLSGEECQYWQQQLEAVSVMFAADQTATAGGVDQTRHQTATRAVEHLERAASHLRSMAGLKVHGGQLCSQIFGFGKFEELESNQFQLGERAFIYIEVENHSSQKTSDPQQTAPNSDELWQTRLRASYAIVNADGKLVGQETYPVIEDIARRQRRDFYLHLPLTIAELPPGDYQLTVSVEDLGNASTATLPAVELSVIQTSN